MIRTPSYRTLWVVECRRTVSGRSPTADGNTNDMTTTRWTTLATATVVAVGVALVSVGSPAGATTKRTKRATTTTVEKRPLRTDSRPPTSRPETTRPDTTDPDRTSTEVPKSETSSSIPEPSKPTRLEPVSSTPAQTEPPRTSVPKSEPPRTEPPKTEPPKTEPPRTEPPRTVPTSQPPTQQPSTEIRTPSTIGLRCTVVERNVRCEWSGEANGAVRYLLLRGHSGDTAGRVIGPFDLSVHSAIDIAPTSKLTFNYLLLAQDASGKNAAHSDPVSVTIP